MFRHVCSFQTQQLGAPRKYPRPETAGCIQQEVSVYVKMHRALKFAVQHTTLIRNMFNNCDSSFHVC